MTTAPETTTEVAASLQRLAELPGWLLAALQPEQVSAALMRDIPELASGALKLRSCKVKRLLLKDDSGRWTGAYNVAVEDPQTGQKRTIVLDGTLTAPGLRTPGASNTGSQSGFGEAGWRGELPELGLELETQPPDTVLAALPQLTDPEQSRALLEQAISSGSPTYHELRLAKCTPEMLSYKPGSRGTLRYHLEYPPEMAGRGWPTTVIGKTYRKDSKARNAFEGMRALWDTPLRSGDVVTIAEPLAYISELKLMVQSPIAEDFTLEDLLKDVLREGTPEQTEKLDTYMRKSAVGLAAFHQSGVQHGNPVALEDRFPEIRDLIGRLAIVDAGLGDAAQPLLARLEAYAAAHPAGAPVPTHGTFNPEQVLIHQGQIGFIDFDDFCMAEPAMDVGLFCSAIRDTGMNVGDDAFFASRDARMARHEQLDIICKSFVDEYAANAPLSRERVMLWQALDFLRNCLHYWIKVKPAEPDTPMLVLEQLLRGMGQ
jgi:hypothetical protein